MSKVMLGLSQEQTLAYPSGGKNPCAYCGRNPHVKNCFGGIIAKLKRNERRIKCPNCGNNTVDMNERERYECRKCRKQYSTFMDDARDPQQVIPFTDPQKEGIKVVYEMEEEGLGRFFIDINVRQFEERMSNPTLEDDPSDKSANKKKLFPPESSFALRKDFLEELWYNSDNFKITEEILQTSVNNRVFDNITAQNDSEKLTMMGIRTQITGYMDVNRLKRVHREMKKYPPGDSRVKLAEQQIQIIEDSFARMQDLVMARIRIFKENDSSEFHLRCIHLFKEEE